MPDKSAIFIITFLIIVVIAGFSAYSILTYSPKSASVSGTLSFPARKPSTSEHGIVVVKYRPYLSRGEYLNTDASITYEDNASWSWNGAANGVSYELIAELLVDGVATKQSEPLVVTAPAQGQKLVLRLDELPSTTTAKNAKISGTIVLNGYIPSTSTIRLLAGEASGTTIAYKVVQTIVNPKPTNTFEWSNSVAGTPYKLRAALVADTKQSSESDLVDVVGGEQSVVLTINSKAIAPLSFPTTTSTTSSTLLATTSTIEGTVAITGPEDVDTAIVVYGRPLGSSSYTQFARITSPTHGGVVWKSGQLPIGGEYEVFSQLWVKGKLIADTRTQTVTVPATAVNFTLNTGIIVPNPGNTPQFRECKNESADHHWDAVLSIPRNPQERIGLYWVWVGDQGGGHSLYSEKLSPADNADLYFTVRVNDGQYYYAQWAYSLCATCKEDANFSKFSSGTRFYCGKNPAATP